MTNLRDSNLQTREDAERAEDQGRSASLYGKPRPRGRPRSTEADEAIFRATWGLLSEGRYDRVTFEAIADRAGCSRPTLYRRFKNKVELIRALVDPLRQTLEPAAFKSGDVADILMAYLEGWVVYLADGGGPAIMALWQARREDPEMSAMLEEIFEIGRKPYISELQKLSPSPRLEEDYVVLVDAMLGAVFFRCVHRLRLMRRCDLQLLVEQAMSVARSFV